MEVRSLKTSKVDVCTECKSVWVDRVDGEVGHVAAEVAPLSIPEAPHGFPSNARCPRCIRNLVFLPYHGAGPLLGRCGECGGAFVPRVSFDVLVDTVADEDSQSPLAVILRGLRSALGD